MIKVNYAKKYTEQNKKLRECEQLVDEAISKAISEGKTKIKINLPIKYDDVYCIIKSMYEQAGYTVNNSFEIEVKEKIILNNIIYYNELVLILSWED